MTERLARFTVRATTRPFYARPYYLGPDEPSPPDVEIIPEFTVPWDVARYVMTRCGRLRDSFVMLAGLRVWEDWQPDAIEFLNALGAERKDGTSL